MINSMSKSNIYIVIILVAVFATNEAAAQAPTTPSYLIETCRTKMGFYTANSTYEANVLSVLNDLSNQSSIAFYNTSAGASGSPNRVFGQYYCRADINASLCYACINEAAQKIYDMCTTRAAVVWYEECTLRYDNVSMVGIEAERPAVFYNNYANVTDPEKLGAAVNKTMARLISEVANGDSLFLATGQEVVSRFETAYCLVQCSPDILRTKCATCLRNASDYISDYLSQVGFSLFPSCQVAYSTQAAFYQVQNAPPPDATTPTLITPSPPKSGTTMLGSREGLNIGLVLSALFFTLIRFG